ncbi:MAG TPA: hypothetical protein VGC04_00435 [Cellulomonas sp.]
MGSRSGVAIRAILLGAAAGCRASLGVAAPLLVGHAGRSGPPIAVRASAVLGVMGELVGDLLPTTPSRLQPPGPQSRAAAAAAGGVLLARRAGVGVLVPALLAAAASAAGTWGGAAWRSWAADRGPDWPAALTEDAVALALAGAATIRLR